jgi:spermidine synthase
MHLIRLRKHRDARRLVAPEGTFSYFHPRQLFTGLGWDAETASLLLLKKEVRSLLILGLGGGTVARQCRALFPEAEITGVEVDSHVLEMAYEHFDLSAVNVRAANLSSETFMKETRKRFDAIIDDVWPPQPGSPKPVLSERGWADLVKSRLREGGMYAANLYSREMSSFEASAAVRRLRPHFVALREVSPGAKETTVICAGHDLRTPREARARLRYLPAPFADGLRHVRFRTL